MRHVVLFLLLILAAPTWAASAPVGKWLFDESSGTAASDASGNGRTATVTAPSWVAGRQGNALLCDGANTRVDLPSGLVTASAGTVAGWIQTTKTFTDYGMLFYAGDGASGDGLGPGNELSLHLTTAAKLEGHLEGTYSAADALMTSNGAVNNGQWRHVALTWGPSGVALFLDGVQVASKPHTGATWNGSILRLGASGLMTRYFQGAIDEISLYNVALTAAEVRALSSAGTLQFSATSATVTEGTATVTCSVTRVGGAAGSIGVSYATSDGTALAGSDYTAKTGTLTWADGDLATKTFTVSITNDTLAEVQEHLFATLSAPTGGAVIGMVPSIQILLRDNDGSGTLALTAQTMSVTEGTATITCTVARTGGSLNAVSVGYRTQDGTAIAGSDYTAISGVLNWAAGDAANKTFTVAITNDTLAESAETLTVILENPTGGAFLLPSPNGLVTISDNDQAGVIQFSAPVVTVGERTSTVTFTATRTGGTAGAVAVSYATSDGTAIAGQDYTTKTGTLSWTAGNASNKTFTVTILNDAVFEPVEGFSVTLSAPTGGASIGVQSRCVGRIQDNENPIIHWRLDETTGTAIADNTDNGNNATATAPTWAAGRFANAMTCNGTTSVITGPTSTVKSDLGTVSVWFKAAAAPTSDDMLFYGSSVSSGNGFGTESEMHVHLDTQGRVGAFIEGGAGTDVSITSAIAYADNAWHHVVFTWDINAQAILYIDGQQIGAATHDALNFTCSSRLLLGKPGASSGYFTGSFDDVIIYDRAIAASEIASLFDPLPPITLTTPTTIGVGVTTYDDRSIIVNGTTLTVDGFHRFANLTVQNGGVVTHPACTTTSVFSVQLQVAGLCNIKSGSSIDVSTRGYLPGYTTGNSTLGGAVQYGGGSSAGNGGGFFAADKSSLTYGSFVAPSDFGSGSGIDGGASGGGLIRLNVGSLVLDGVLRANGGSASSGGGGGSIWVVANDISGAGSIAANGGSAGTGPGGGGRVSVTYISGALPGGGIQAFGGLRVYNNSYTYAGAGTIYVKRSGQAPQLQICNDPNGNFHVAYSTPLGPSWPIAELATLIVRRAVVEATGDRDFLTVDLQENATLTVPAHVPPASPTPLRWTIQGTLDVHATAGLDLSARGYVAGYTTGNTTAGASFFYGGGSYGGRGGGFYAQDQSCAVYGSFADPADFGSGSGLAEGAGASGGGQIRLTVGTLNLQGAIRANGGSGNAGGSGGAIWISAGVISGSGVISADGGAGSAGPGGGGRIAVNYTSGSLPSGGIHAFGGIRAYNNTWMHGGAGTVFVKRTGQFPSLEIANDSAANYTYAYSTPIGSPWPITESAALIIRRAVVESTGDRSLVSVDIQDKGVLSVPATVPSQLPTALRWTIAGSLTVASTGSINLSGKGYLSGWTQGNTQVGAPVGSAGGSYGGRGVNSTSPSPNLVNGQFIDPDGFGTGGSVNYPDMVGGGLLRISAATMTIHGSVSADGVSAAGGASGGGILLTAQTIQGQGMVTASGTGGNVSAGGGGRIAVFADVLLMASTQFRANGGVFVDGYGRQYPASPGTVYLRQRGSLFGLLVLAGSGVAPLVPTSLYYGPSDSSAIGQPVCPEDFEMQLSGAATFEVIGDSTVFDADRDLLPSWNEFSYATHPRIFDTNQDGIGDGTAVLVGISPVSLDVDGDGVSNQAERGMGTDPTLVDSDGDGVTDLTDAYPVDPGRTNRPATVGDTTAPTIVIQVPANLSPLN